MSTAMNEYLTLEEAARLCPCSYSALAESLRLGFGPPCYKVTSRRYFKREDVLQWVASIRVPAGTPC